ncbi:hypothetical protein DH2020_012758 [Rehmannia glutinosa]|uniref:Uncharacterized protein n=1 Tax=Rehmannia glutinosa TaxID=99300 RepID=A0ABR0X3H1_REHGL
MGPSFLHSCKYLASKMVSSTIQKLLRNQSQSASKILTLFRKPLPPLTPLVTQIPQISEPSCPTSFSNHPKIDHLKPNHSFCAHVYPSFSFGFFLNPISPTSLIRSEPNDEMAPEESNIIRADSEDACRQSIRS